MITIGRLHLTDESCPLMYPITDFFVCYLEEGLKEFVEQNQSKTSQFEFQLSNEIKARIEIFLVVIEEFKINTQKASELV
jgi:hypothetical protein